MLSLTDIALSLVLSLVMVYLINFVLLSLEVHSVNNYMRRGMAKGSVKVVALQTNPNSMVVITNYGDVKYSYNCKLNSNNLIKPTLDYSLLAAGERRYKNAIKIASITSINTALKESMNGG